MTKPASAKDEPMTEREFEKSKRDFRNSDLYRQLKELNCPIEELYTIPTNAKRFEGISRDHMNPKVKWNYSIIGQELFDYTPGAKNLKQNNRAQMGFRKIKNASTKLLAHYEANGHSARHFWFSRELKDWDEAKGRTETEGMAQTINRFCNPDIKKDFDSTGIYDYLVEILELWQTILGDKEFVRFEDIESWIGKMNWNKNSGWPYNMSISEERFRSIDLPNFIGWLTALTKASTVDELEKHMNTAPPNVPNANREIDIMFNRKPDRVIWGIRLLIKPLGAYFSKNTTSNMPGSGIGWYSVPDYYTRFSEACSHGDVMVGAEDFNKYDSNIPAEFFTLAYEIVKESDFLKHNPEMRNVLLSLMYILTKPAKLMVHPGFRVTQLRGLRSGHPLTQWLGSWLHLALSRRWRDIFGCDWEMDDVLSDDAIRILRGVTYEEMHKLVHEDMAKDSERFGLEFNPKKTVVCDPFDNEISMGYHTRHEREIFVGDSTFFLKQMAAPDIAGSHGNSIGAVNSIIQGERPIRILQAEMVDPYITGVSLDKGKSDKGTIYDLTRVVDIVSSTGQGNPLYDETIEFVKTAWPNFDKRASKILENQLDSSWQEASVLYANNLERGITRKQVVEDLLDPERESLWIHRDFL